MPGLRPDEEVLMVIRKHGIVYAKIMSMFWIIVVMPTIVFLSVWFWQYAFEDYKNASIIALLASTFYILYGILFTCISWMSQAFDIFILTNQRLMDITQDSLLRHSTTSTPLEHIQDATSKVHGFVPTLLNYGDLIVQTASGTATEIFIDQIPHPGDTARQLMDAVAAKHEENNVNNVRPPNDGVHN